MCRSSRIAFATAAVLLVACTDRNPVVTDPAPGPSAPVQQLDCTASVREGTLACRDAAGASGASRTIYGGQKVWVYLASTNVSYDAEARIFQADVTVQNLLQQSVGTFDGVAPDPAGIRVFFHNGPYAAEGSGAVWVANADGTDAITAGDQPFFRYPGILRPNQVSAPRTWKWHLDPTVERFAFTVFIDAQLSPAVVIDEIMAHPGTASEADGEWFEVYNAGIAAVDLDGWNIASGGDAGHTISGHLVVPPRSYLVLGGSEDGEANGGAPVDYAYAGIGLGNGTDDWLALRLPGGVTADSVSWSAAEGETASPPPVGVSLALVSLGADNLHLGGTGSPWQPSPVPFGTGQLGSPGRLNPAGTSPDLSRVAFASGRDGNMEIYVMNPDGTGQVRLTDNTWYDSDPDWSPDRSKIVFTSWRDGNTEIYVMNADGTGQTRLTNHPASDEWPAWSPDGSKIAFTSMRAGGFEIYVMNADGTGQTRLTFDADYDGEPAWSPDGSKIAFTTHRPGGSLEISTMNADGTGRTRLTNNPAQDRFPAWSPDGTRIAFLSQGDGIAEIYVMQVDGTGQMRLTTGGGESAAWSPDGSRIAFTRRDDHFGHEIYVMNADGANPVRLTYTIGEDERPAWR